MSGVTGYVKPPWLQRQKLRLYVLLAYWRLMDAERVAKLMATYVMRYASPEMMDVIAGEHEVRHKVYDPDTGDEYLLPPGSTVADVYALMDKIREARKNDQREAV